MNVMLSDYVSSLIRTYVPAVVGWVVAQLIQLGIPVDDGLSGALVYGLGGAAGAAWYALVRWAESRWPQLSWLLGSPKQPTYGEGES